jgi:hypothetical protein
LRLQISSTIARAGIKMELYHQIMQKWQSNFSLYRPVSILFAVIIGENEIKPIHYALKI